MALSAARSKRKLLTHFHSLLSSPSSSRRFLRHLSPVPRSADHSPFLRLPDARASTLPSGLRVVTQYYPATTRMASVAVWVDAGSRFEVPGTNGTAHFLEHMVFRGTSRRPTAQALEVEIEDMGARFNARTTREHTSFFADVQARHVPAALDVLADILQNSRFPNDAIKRERRVIFREMEEVNANMMEVIFDHLHSATFQGHPLGDTILGHEENIRSISGADLQQYISTHYTGHRMVVSAAGAVNHDEVVDQVSKLFTGFSTNPTTADQLVKANPAIFTGSEVRVVNVDMPLAHLAIAFKGSSWINPSSIPLMVTQFLLESWSRSIGIGNCSECALAYGISTGSLAESIMAFNTIYQDTGLFGIYTIAALKSALMLHMDGSTAVAQNNGRQMLTYGRIVPLLELFARIDAVDRATIMETVKEFIIDKDVAIAAVGPLSNLPDQRWLRSLT